jgi:multidrug efflux pump subunit AcrA (membrane-fusion protein)
MRALLAALLGLCSLALAACGGTGHEGPSPPVRLTLTGPGDGAVVRGEHVQLTGRVVPAAAGVSVGARWP